MKTIGIITNTAKDKNYNYTFEVLKSIRENGLKAVLPVQAKLYIDTEYADFMEEDEFIKSTDIIISIGGDGTFLEAARMSYRMNIPLLGVNLGSLGFLTDVDKNEISKAIQYLAEGNYNIEERMMIDAKVIRKNKAIGEGTALNDVVISSGAISRILHVELFVNDEFVDRYPGDGLIIATPTGSTAYSLSAGGPIVEPDMDVFILTPICAHLLYTRSYVAGTDRVIRARIDENENYRATVTIDGKMAYEVRGGDEVIVSKSPYSVKLVKIKAKNFFSILRKKMHYRGEGIVRDEI